MSMREEKREREHFGYRYRHFGYRYSHFASSLAPTRKKEEKNRAGQPHPAISGPHFRAFADADAFTPAAPSLHLRYAYAIRLRVIARII